MSRAKRTSIPAESTLAAVDDRQTGRLIARIKAGDGRALGTLLRRFRNPVSALAYRMVNDRDEAADITQDVFVKMSRNIWRYDETKRFSTWLYRVTVNAAIDHRRRHSRHRHESLQDLAERVSNDEADPELSFRRRQIDGYIREAARSLNERQRSAFLLRDVAGRSIDDVATIMKVPKATVRWYLHRARGKIRQELIRRCPHLLILLGIR